MLEHFFKKVVTKGAKGLRMNVKGSERIKRDEFFLKEYKEMKNLNFSTKKLGPH